MDLNDPRTQEMLNDEIDEIYEAFCKLTEDKHYGCVVGAIAKLMATHFHQPVDEALRIATLVEQWADNAVPIQGGSGRAH